MTLSGIDILILLLYIGLIFGVGMALSKRASRSTEEFFVSGRSLPWWIIGTSMVATTFAADTPLVVSGLIAQGGIFKNWIWWYWGIGAIFTVFFFSSLWNRAGITTDAELIELRYDGKPAAALRFYRATWFGIFQNVLVLAWVMKAMAKIIIVVMGWEGGATVLGMHAEVFTVLCLFTIAVTYTAMSGLWGVVMTDLLQFILAMAGSIYLAVAAFRRIGGIDGIVSGLSGHGFDVDRIMQIIPERGALTSANPFTEFLILILVVWWASYTIDGGGYLSQRLFAAKNERHSVFGYLWFCIAHIALRPWPWIVVGLCGMAYFGTVGDPETYYPMMMREILPPGLFGFVIASFFAAFMSTIDTQLNWGSSLVVNDLCKRFFWKGKSERQYIAVARLSILGLAVLGALASFAVSDISFVWKLVVSVTAGIGSVYVARWYWWRVNAWSEIAAMATAMITTLVLALIGRNPSYAGDPLLQFPFSTAITTALSVGVWISVTLLTPPVGREHLARFHARVRPGGKGWKAVAPGAAAAGFGRDFALGAAKVICGLVLVGGMLVGTGRLILGKTGSGLIFLLIAAAAAVGLFLLLRDRGK